MTTIETSNDAVDEYLTQLEEAVDVLRDHLDQIGQKTVERRFDEIQGCVDQMPTALANLESLLERRGKLLNELTANELTTNETAPDGWRPKSLRAYLRNRGDADRLLLAETLAKRIEQQRRRAVTVFTTHYWLFETTRDLVRILTTRGPSPRTYGPQSRGIGGGLLDEAA